MSRAGPTDGPRKRLGWTPVALAGTVTLAFGVLVFPRIGLPLPAVFGLLVAWGALLIGANLRALKNLTASSTRLPRWRTVGGFCAAALMALLGVIAVLDGPLQTQVRDRNEATAVGLLAELPDGPPPHLVSRADELTALLDGPADTDPDLSRLIVELDRTRESIADVQAKMPCELDGTCGSLRPGAREVYLGLVDVRAGLLEREAQLVDQIDARREAVAQLRSEARTELAELTGDLTEHETQQRGAQRAIEDGKADNGTVRRFQELGNASLLADPTVQIFALAGFVVVFALYALADTGGLALLLRHYNRPRP